MKGNTQIKSPKGNTMRKYTVIIPMPEGDEKRFTVEGKTDRAVKMNAKKLIGEIYEGTAMFGFEGGKKKLKWKGPYPMRIRDEYYKHAFECEIKGSSDPRFPWNTNRIAYLFPE